MDYGIRLELAYNLLALLQIRNIQYSTVKLLPHAYSACTTSAPNCPEAPVTSTLIRNRPTARRIAWRNNPGIHRTECASTSLHYLDTIELFP